MDELVRERGFTEGSKIASDLAMINQANETWGRAIVRIRLLENEMEQTFAALAQAEQDQARAGNGVAAPNMSAPVKAAWRVYLDLKKKDSKATARDDLDYPQPPILDWPDP